MEINDKQNEQYWGMDEKTFLIMLHISQFAGFIIPYAGFLLPLVMWLTNKDKNVLIDEHGKNIVNWLISGTIYACVAGILVLILIGIPLLIGLGVLAIIFPILGAVKASNKEYWDYPLTLKFFN